MYERDYDNTYSTYADRNEVGHELGRYPGRTKLCHAKEGGVCLDGHYTGNNRNGDSCEHCKISS